MANSNTVPTPPIPVDFEFWGAKRHEAIGLAAESQIRSRKAKQQVKRLLDRLGRASLGAIANWADDMKRRRPQPGDDPETRAFLLDVRNRDNDRWHYVNLPLGVVGYDRARYPRFTSDIDVVQMTLHCIRSLQGGSPRFSEANALRLLVHLVADLHQPVHVGCGYIADPESMVPFLVADPERAAAERLQSDRGGNALLLEIGGNLHSYWDSGLLPAGMGPLVADVSDEPLKTDSALVASLIAANAGALVVMDASGPIDRWPAQWVDETLGAARSAYESIRIRGPYNQHRRGYEVAWEGEASYVRRNAPILQEQMTRAGIRLAALLDAIWP
jgi:hypothetical protein